MKNTIIFLLSIFCFSLSAQNVDIKEAGQNVRLNLWGTYLVKQDTTQTGVITVTLTPTTQAVAEVKSELVNINSLIAEAQASRTALDDAITLYNKRKRDIERLLTRITPANAVKKSKQ